MTGPDTARAVPGPGTAERPGRTFDVLVTDLDGTLLDAEGVLRERTVRVLRALAAAGVRIVFATARPAASARAVLAPAAGLGAVLVSSNGAVAGDLDGDRPYWVRGMPSSTVRAVVARLEAGAAWAVDREGDRLLGPGWPDVLAAGPLVERSVAGPPAAADPEPALCLMVTGGPADAAALCRPQDAVVWTSSQPGLLEFSAAGADKVSALSDVLVRLGRTWQDVLAFGDSLNDAGMLAAAGRGVAMANACPEVRAAADAVAGHHAADGVAVWLEEQCPTPI
ncbi:HAD hydrolase family protein [Streptomyces sp. TG1A-8]|uniref:HAD family hydrolase n=1 Tax=Streptomyces sp. TG1A-8 TaxID=3051385 RepID=UPI00265BE970|nr:HAD hydrolase family protein [Streptomyces sp. TG1A-8]MDO0924225.1 HAD hydrolase family protein [Streptomyces sp. TG1A-8]